MFDAQWIPAVFPIRHPALVFRNATSVSSCSLAQIPAGSKKPRGAQTPISLASGYLGMGGHGAMVVEPPSPNLHRCNIHGQSGGEKILYGFMMFRGEESTRSLNSTI